ncbi:MAG: hypothetical protein WB440_00360 [Steroidobacteraceae bacterium]|jgi:hypothetical protein
MRQWLQVLVICVAHSSFAWCAVAAHDAQQKSAAERFQAWKAAAAQKLGARADADSLATAAALLFAGASAKPGADAAALDLAARASALAPSDAAIAWLRLQLCRAAPDCDFRDAATAMRWIAADNAAAWLPNLSLAQKDRDKTEVDRILADMVLGKRFDIYWNRINVMMIDALKSVAGSLPGASFNSDAGRLRIVRGIAGSEVVPAYHPLIDACRSPGGAGERRDSCLKLARIMQQGDVISSQLVGFGMERRFASPDGREARAIDDRRHVLDYRLSTAAKFDDPLLPWLRNKRARWRLARMRSTQREEDVCLAIIREQGMAPDPPGERPVSDPQHP